MVGQMTYGKRQWDEFDSEMRKLIPVVTDASVDMIKMIDADTDAFNDYMVGCDLTFFNLFYCSKISVLENSISLKATHLKPYLNKRSCKLYYFT